MCNKVKMIKPKDISIIKHLRCNARQTVTDIARQTKIPATTIYDRIRAQEKDVITKHTCILNFPKIGYQAKAYIAVKANNIERANLEKFLRSHKNMNSMFKVDSGYDFLIEMVFEDMSALYNFIEELDEKSLISDHKLYHVIQDIEQENFLAV